MHTCCCILICECLVLIKNFKENWNLKLKCFWKICLEKEKGKFLSFLLPPLFLDFRPSPSSRVSPDQPPPGVLCRPSPAPAQRPLPRPSPPAVFSAWTCSPAPPLSSGGFGSSNREPKPLTELARESSPSAMAPGRLELLFRPPLLLSPPDLILAVHFQICGHD